MEFEETKTAKIKRFFRETIRILRNLKKPSMEEFKGIIKVTSLGLAVIGVIGFLIFLIKQLLFS